MEVTEKYELPDDFAIVPAVAFKKEKISISEPPNITVTIKGSLDEAIAKEKCWLDHAKNRTMETIPPTQDALLQHCRRFVYQAGIWSISNKAQQELRTKSGWKLSKEYKWSPVWITLPVASKAFTKLVKCGCKSSRGCGGRYSCKKAQWRYAKLCSCYCEK